MHDVRHADVRPEYRRNREDPMPLALQPVMRTVFIAVLCYRNELQMRRRCSWDGLGVSVTVESCPKGAPLD